MWLRSSLTQPRYGQILHRYAGKSVNEIYRTSPQLHAWGLFWCLWSKTWPSSNQGGIVVWEPGWVEQPPAAREVGEREKEIGAGKAATSLHAGEMLGYHLIPESSRGGLKVAKGWEWVRLLCRCCCRARSGLSSKGDREQLCLLSRVGASLIWTCLDLEHFPWP